MRILINTPNLKALGGVANHYYGLKNYWTENVQYNSVLSHKFKRLLLPITVIVFVYKILFFNPDMVLLNPSLGVNALKRDFFFLKLAKFFHKKVTVFIHGFSWDYAKTADWKWIAKNLNNADCIIVLAKAFQEELQRRGITTPIELSTTKVMDSLVDGFDINTRRGNADNILVLSRIETAKGIYEALDTFILLKPQYPELKLTYVGDGSELEPLKQKVNSLGISDVRFTGALSGEPLKQEFKNADIFFFTSHGEGMPTVVLEAMAYGLPVLTRYVGGLCDFFEDGKMGAITDSMSPKVFADMLETFLSNPNLTLEVSLYNYQYAKSHFMASTVAKQIESVLIKYV